VTISRYWYLRKDGGATYGPVAEEVLCAWAAEGRVAPEDYISADGDNWRAPFELASLEMVWCLELPDGLEYGPAHREAFEGMLREGALSPPVRLRHAVTGERLVLGAEADIAAEAPRKGDTQRIADTGAPPSAAQDASAAEAPLSAEMFSSPSRVPPEVAVEEDQSSASEGGPTAAVMDMFVEPGGGVAAQPSPASDGAAPTSTAPPQPTLTWQAIARERDHFERETTRWRAMFESEAAAHAATARRLEEVERRAEHDRLAADAERDDLRRRVAELEREVDRAAGATGVADARLVDAYHELVRNYDLLVRELSAKREDLRLALETAEALRREHDQTVSIAREQAARERAAAEQIRHRFEELEQAHLELLKSYRELNDRYIRLRDSGSPPPQVSGPSPDPAAGPSGPSAGPRVRLWR